MKRHRAMSGGITAVVAAVITAAVVSLAGQSTAPSGQPSSRGVVSARETLQRVTRSADAQRALLDKYCVSCHNDRVKTANLSLQGLDLTRVADHAETWEKVIRKLRAGVMPPPDVPRPPLPEYEGLRDWLEGETDRASAAKPNPGAVVLHRLNRTDTRTLSAIYSIYRLTRLRFCRRTTRRMASTISQGR